MTGAGGMISHFYILRNHHHPLLCSRGSKKCEYVCQILAINSTWYVMIMGSLLLIAEKANLLRTGLDLSAFASCGCASFLDIHCMKLVNLSFTITSSAIQMACSPKSAFEFHKSRCKSITWFHKRYKRGVAFRFDQRPFLLHDRRNTLTVIPCRHRFAQSSCLRLHDRA